MDDSRLLKRLLYGELAQSTRPRGAPKRQYKDQLKRSLTLANINLLSKWPETESPGEQQHILAPINFEEKKIQWEETKRWTRKELPDRPRLPPTLPCGHCPRHFYHRLGLISHVKQKHLSDRKNECSRKKKVWDWKPKDRTRSGSYYLPPSKFRN